MESPLSIPLLPGSPMAAHIAIVSLTDSFSEVWPQLAEYAGVELEAVSDVAEIGSMHTTQGLVIAAAGAESDVLPLLRDLGTLAAPDTVVVGVDTNYRLVAALLKAGASNYFAFPADLGICRSWFVDRSERARDRRRGAAFAADERERFDFSKMIGESPRLRASLLRTARVIPKGTASVLITGETGTGKDLLARAVHYNGTRATGPFVEVNCTTLPENLLEAELFGFEPGAFTDARVAKPGLFEVADGGTLFLDEIGDLSLPLQAKLLRVLEAKRVRRLGSITEFDIDVRIVAATHVYLEGAVQAGTFRQDLYYRLNVMPIQLPPLRDRGDDVVRLAEHFLERFSREYEIETPELSQRIRQALRLHTWPGNIRELRNSIERAVLLGDGEIYLEDLFPEEMKPPPAAGVLPFPASMEAIARAAASATVERCGGNKSEAAKVLGISRKHLYTLLRDRREE